jgi:hypothetical protein
MTDDVLAPPLFDVALKVMRALKPLPDADARRRVIRAAALLLNVELETVGLREIDR